MRQHQVSLVRGGMPKILMSIRSTQTHTNASKCAKIQEKKVEYVAQVHALHSLPDRLKVLCLL